MFVVDVLITQVITDRYERARKLCAILEERDDDLLPVFCQALIDTGQRQVARLLGFPGSSVTFHCSNVQPSSTDLDTFHWSTVQHSSTGLDTFHCK